MGMPRLFSSLALVAYLFGASLGHAATDGRLGTTSTGTVGLELRIGPRSSQLDIGFNEAQFQDHTEWIPVCASRAQARPVSEGATEVVLAPCWPGVGLVSEVRVRPASSEWGVTVKRLGESRYLVTVEP